MTLAGSLAILDAIGHEWDVVVIGAGVGGSLAARELARSGCRVLLIDKKCFPRRKVCGACLNGAALGILSQIGLSDLVRNLGGLHLNQFALRYGGRQLNLPLSAGMSISREALDTALIQSAIDAGASFLSETCGTVTPQFGGRNDGTDGTNVTDRLQTSHSSHQSNSRAVTISPNCSDGQVDPFYATCATLEATTDSCRTVCLTQHETTAIAHARVVIIATGLGAHGLPANSEWKTESDERSRIGVGCTIEDSSSAFGSGTIWMGVGDRGYVGLVRIEDKRLNIAAALDRRLLADCGSPGVAARHVLTAAGFLSPEAMSSAEWLGTVALTRRTCPVASRQVFVIGDAAGYVEPFTGEGMAWAMLSGIAVAPWVRRAIDGWSSAVERGWARDHQRLIRRQQRTCRMLSRLLRFPGMIGMTMSLLQRWPWLARYVMPEPGAASVV